MLQLIWSIVLFVMLVLAIGWALYERDKRKKSDREWDRGMDEMSSDYEQMLLSAYEQNQLLDQTAEGYYEEVEEATRVIQACVVEVNDLQEENRTFKVNAESTIMELTDEMRTARSLNRIKNEQLEMVLKDVETYEELYAEAATELLETTTEIERVAREVHDWTVRGGPFDA